ncbi:hypothetical protein KIN20_024950 [Parelaphostrongylus tenuis]|uniref:Uncharacterized protein n=1 Tax=Parelaphostrongylus tenuis TaxID=148309 RepID=A0AAD5MUB4_PARTN|nr:hypothetical protein KIN20_024950 [Parelaphostrongylus tenuis]
MSVMRGNGLDDGEHSPIAESSGSEMDEQDEAMEDVQNSDILDNDGVASCYAARFEIPDRDEDLLSRTTSSYVVKKENIPIDTAQTVIRRLASATEEEDYEKIYVYFDDLFHICRLDTTIRSWSIWLDLIRTLIELFKPFKQSVVNVLCHAVSAGENLPENLAEVCADRVEVLHMFVYLIQRLTFHIEGTVIKRAYEQLGTSAKECENRESNENDDLNEGISEEDVVVWTDLRVEILKIIRFICYINIRRGNSDSVENAIRFLWRPAEPSTQMLRALAAIIVNFAAHPRFAETSSKPDLKELFEYLRPICVDFKLASEVARIIVKASVNFEYLNYRHVKDIRDMDQMMSHMLYYAGMLRPREASLQCLPRPFALLIEKIAESAPETFFENVRGVVPFLEYDPPSMRSAILKAFSQVVCGPDMKPRYLRPGRDARIIRDIMTDQLQAHLADNNLQVRLDVLHYWITIAANRRLPCDSVRKGLYFAVVERLRDKSSPIRIDAMRLLVICVLFNVYGDKLDFESLSEIIRKLSAYKEQVEFVDPDRPGFFVVVDRFKSFEKKMRKMFGADTREQVVRERQ